MSRSSGPGGYGSGLGQRLLRFALLVWAAAWCIAQAVDLISAVWVRLLVIAVVIATVVAGVAWWRGRRQGW